MNELFAVIKYIFADLRTAQILFVSFVAYALLANLIEYWRYRA